MKTGLKGLKPSAGVGATAGGWVGPKKLIGPCLGCSSGASVVNFKKMEAKLSSGVGAGVTGTNGLRGRGLKGLLT